MRHAAALVTILVAICGPLGAQQANTAAASWTIGTRDGPPWPITGVALPPGQPVVLRIGGSPGAVFWIAAAGGLAATPVQALGGLIHLDLATLAIVVDPALNPGFVTNGAGIWIATPGVPASLGTILPLAHQAAVANPASAWGATPTAATLASAAATVTATPPLALGNNTTVLVNLAPLGLSVQYYGVTYNQIWVDSNGYITFGPVPLGSDFTSTPSEFRATAPRVAAFWSDLNPAIGGAVTATVVNSGPSPWCRVDWVAVPWNVFVAPPITCWIEVHGAPSGEILIGPAAIAGPPSEVLCGITPGANLGPAVSEKNLSVLNTTPITGAPFEDFFEWFGSPFMPYYTASFNNPWDLSGFVLRFSPANPAGTAYTGTAWP